MELTDLNYYVQKAQPRTVRTQPDLIVFYVAEGQLSVTCREEKYNLSRGDILLVNPGTGYEISGCRDALLGVAVYPLQLLTSVMRKGQLLFYCNSAADVSHSYKPLRDILFKLTSGYAAEDKKTLCLRYGQLFELLDVLTESFQAGGDDTQSPDEDDDQRMRHIMTYILSNLDKEISLNRLAEDMYVSPSTLSRIFKKSTGVYFADYVNSLRVQMAAALLEHTDQNMTRVAMSCGFMSSASFNRVFRKVTGTTPSGYRDACRNRPKKAEEAKKEEDSTVRAELLKKGYLEQHQNKARSIYVDLSKTAPVETLPKVWDQVINIGPIWDLTNANVQYHTLYLCEHLHFKYVRIWNIFSKRMMILNDKSSGVYNYSMVDQVLDFLVTHGLIPFLDFGRRPDTAIDSEGNTLFYDEQYLEFPSCESWNSLVDDFLSHMVEMYSRDVVSTWVFELSRDAMHGGRLYKDDSFDYFDAFSYFYHSVKQHVPAASFGGLGDIALKDWNYILRLLQRCNEHNIKPDFISLGLFGQDFTEEENTLPHSDSPETEEAELSLISRMHEILAQAGFPDLKLYVTEWNNTLSNRNYLNDSCYRAAYLAKKISVISRHTDMIGIMSGTDWVSNYVDSVGIVDGAIGLLTKDMIRKPAFYAVRFLNGLGEYLLDIGDNYIATRDERGGIYLLLFNYTWTRQDAYLGTADASLTQYSAMASSDEEPLNLNIMIDHLEASGEYILKKETLNRENGSILDEWGTFAYDLKLRRDDIKYLQASSIPTLSMKKETVDAENPKLILATSLQSNEISFVHIYRRK